LPKQYYDVMDPFVSLSAAAAVTKTIRLGTGVCLITQRDPIQTAKLVASLDQVSGGRFLFGIGGGWNAEEMEDHGTVFKTRFKLMRERVEAMKEIWTKDAAEYHGEMVDFAPMAAWPKPAQKPHPPVIVGGAFPHSARRALRYGNGWIPNASRAHYADVTDYLPQFKQMASEVGRDVAGAGADVEVEPVPGADDAVPEQRALGQGSALVRTGAGQGLIVAAPGVEHGDRDAVHFDRLAPSDGDLSHRGDAAVQARGLVDRRHLAGAARGRVEPGRPAARLAAVLVVRTGSRGTGGGAAAMAALDACQRCARFPAGLAARGRARAIRGLRSHDLRCRARRGRAGAHGTACTAVR
jgi:probable F420-dependent oxidoreductase